jgi:transposase
MSGREKRLTFIRQPVLLLKHKNPDSPRRARPTHLHFQIDAHTKSPGPLSTARIASRPRRRPQRILDAILYVIKCGVPWRYLPADFPPWKTVYHVFRKWALNHQWAALNDALRILVRKTHDSRQADQRPQAASAGGYFGVGARGGGDSSQHSGTGRSANGAAPRIGLVHLAAPPVGGWLLHRRCLCPMGQRTPPQAGGQGRQTLRRHQRLQSGAPPLDGRANLRLLMRHRRLVRDYENTKTSAEAWIFIAMIRIQLRWVWNMRVGCGWSCNGLGGQAVVAGGGR